MPKISHIDAFERNLGDVIRLLEVHSLVANTKAGRATALQVLNRSTVVLLAACWEAYVEDLAVAAFDWLLVNCRDSNAFPKKVRARATRSVREDKDELAVWALASDGWRNVLSQYRNETIQSTVATFNSPKAERIDELYANLIGLQRLSSHWRWRGVSPDSSRVKLGRLLTLRGNIAHRAQHGVLITRPELDRFVQFTHRLSILSHNAVVRHLTSITSRSPWTRIDFAPIDIGSPDDRRKRIKPSWSKN